MIPREILKKIRQIEIRTDRLVTETLAGAYRSLRKLQAASLAIIVGWLLFPPCGQAEDAPLLATQKARTFLVGLLDSDIGLLPEYRGAKTYWLYHDNYLAAKVLDSSHPDIARAVRSAIEREGIHRSDKIELIFCEAKNPLPFRQYQLQDVRHVADKVIRTEVVITNLLAGWKQYADLLLLAAIAETNPVAARQNWAAALKLWDGRGFRDAATQHNNLYATYKLAFAMLAANKLSLSAKLPNGLTDKLLSLQDDSGGWITDYDVTGKKIGKANVETTCLSILALESRARKIPVTIQPQTSPDH